MTARALGLSLAVAASAATGCGPSAERAEAGRVLVALGALRQAPAEPPERRQALLEALERERAVSPRALAARDACARAYRLLLEGSALERRVRAGLARPSEAAPGLLGDLSLAEEKIRQSRDAMPECERASAELRLSP